MLADAFDAFLIDLDGVVYVGDVPVPGAEPALSRLRTAGKAIRFLTNDPRSTRLDLVRRLQRMGVAATSDEIVTSGWATARHVRSRGRGPVRVLGSAGLACEMRSVGVDVVGPGATASALVVGCDERLGYVDLADGLNLLAAGAAFIVTNPDPSFPSVGGERPATGAIAAALQSASRRKPEVIGKPAAPMFAAALGTLPAGARVAMVGDGVDTDVIGAQRAGIPAILIGRVPALGPVATIPDLSGLFDRRVRTLPSPRPLADRIEAGVAAVVLDATGRVLLGCRTDNGRWGLPSGHIEVGETVAEAVVREVQEETGLAVVVRRLVGVYSDPASQSFAYPDGTVIQFVTTCFLCQPSGGRVPRADSKETSAVGFFALEELPDHLLPMHPRWLGDATSGRPAVAR